MRHETGRMALQLAWTAKNLMNQMNQVSVNFSCETFVKDGRASDD